MRVRARVWDTPPPFCEFTVPKSAAIRAVRGSVLPIVLSALALLAGCADTHGIRPRAERLDADTLDMGSQLRAARCASDCEAAWPRQAWWRTFGDAQLDRLVDSALANSPTLAVAEARVREAEALLDNARAGEGPSLNGDLALNRQHWPESTYYGGGTLAGTNTFNNTAHLTFNYPLDFFGRLKNARLAALDATRAAVLSVRAAQLSLSSNLVQAYVQLSLQYALLDVQRKTLQDRQQVLSFAQRRLVAGIGTQLEVSEAQAPLPQTELAIAQTEASIALLRNQIAALMGQGPGAGEGLARPTLRLAAAPALPARLPAELVGHRPDVVAARWLIEAQLHDVAAARAAFYPNINLAATGGAMAVSSTFWTFTRLSSMGFTAGPALSLPIFDSGRLRAQLGTASARADIAVGQYNDTVVRAMREIADQVSTLNSLQAQQRIAERGLATAERSHAIALTGFRRGLTPYLNVLNAEERLFQEQEAISRLRAQHVSAFASLAAALGGGLASPADLPDAPAAAAAPAAARPEHVRTAPMPQ